MSHPKQEYDMTDEYADFVPQEPAETTMTEGIGKLALALSKAQGEISGALKDSTNPFFQSNYADLGNVIAACRGPLSKNELAVIQTTEPHEMGVVVISTLVHSSGQWIRGKLRMKPTKNDPQGVGSALTYARRYAYAALVGVAQVDDDGNAASHGQATADHKTNMNGTKVDEKKLDALAGLAIEIVDTDDMDAGPAKARELYEPLNNDERIYFNGVLRDKKFTNASTGRENQYWRAFKQYLEAAA